MGLFKSKSAKKQARFLKEQMVEQQKQLESIKKEVDSLLNSIIIFPGSQSEFDAFFGFSTDFIDLGMRNRGLKFLEYHHIHGASNPFSQYYSFNFQKDIYTHGIIALVNATLTYKGSGSCIHEIYFGLPIVKRQSTEMP